MASLLSAAGCAHPQAIPLTSYEAASPEARAKFKSVMLPLPPGTAFTISQGAFGRNTHHDPGHEYTWDFDVPIGTPVLSVDDGTVLQVWEPQAGGGCDPKFNASPHNIKVEHRDGTVAQYVHVQSGVKDGDVVRKGQVIAVTAINGFICAPQLDFGVYVDRNHLPGSDQMRNIPLTFDGLPDDGMAREGFEGVVPKRLDVTLVRGSDREKATRAELEGLLAHNDLAPYIFTRQVEIEAFAIPHSSPMLRLNTRCEENLDCLLTEFLHEQIHWFLDYHAEGTRAAEDDLRKLFPNAPPSGSEGQVKTTDSSYLHLIVGWLELQGDRRYLGTSRAKALLSENDIYPWVYAQVLNHEDEIGEIVKHRGLEIR